MLGNYALRSQIESFSIELSLGNRCVEYDIALSATYLIYVPLRTLHHHW